MVSLPPLKTDKGGLCEALCLDCNRQNPGSCRGSINKTPAVRPRLKLSGNGNGMRWEGRCSGRQGQPAQASHVRADGQGNGHTVGAEGRGEQGRRHRGRLAAILEASRTPDRKFSVMGEVERMTRLNFVFDLDYGEAEGGRDGDGFGRLALASTRFKKGSPRSQCAVQIRLLLSETFKLS